MARKQRVQGGFEAAAAPAPKQQEQSEERLGICCECGHGGFKLRVYNRVMFRTCKQCGHEKEV